MLVWMHADNLLDRMCTEGPPGFWGALNRTRRWVAAAESPEVFLRVQATQEACEAAQLLL